MIAPDGNRSVTARSITFRRRCGSRMSVRRRHRRLRVRRDAGGLRAARSLGLIELRPDVSSPGINHGANLGDDITYSGTVAAALEGIVLGIPGIAVSHSPRGARWTSGSGTSSTSTMRRPSPRARRPARRRPLPAGTLLNVNVPAGDIGGVEVARLGKRIYQDQLELTRRTSGALFRVYGDSPVHEDEPGTDLPRSRPAASRSRRCTSTSPPSTGSRAARLRPRAAAGEPRVRRSAPRSPRAARLPRAPLLRPRRPGDRRRRLRRAAGRAAQHRARAPGAADAGLAHAAGRRRAGGKLRRSRTCSRCSRWPTRAPRRSCAPGSSGCATTWRARASRTRRSSSWPSRRSTGWRCG